VERARTSYDGVGASFQLSLIPSLYLSLPVEESKFFSTFGLTAPPRVGRGNLIGPTGRFIKSFHWVDGFGFSRGCPSDGCK